uniref:Uncharacterized protein n=1 Tax=Knipowitschia caucasica TaxID=637954 RepID=A0AAV2MCP0_KNICA
MDTLLNCSEEKPQRRRSPLAGPLPDSRCFSWQKMEALGNNRRVIILRAPFCWTLLLLLLSIPAAAAHVCEERDYLTNDNICCERCPAGYKLVENCRGQNTRTNCTQCPKGEFMDRVNYSPNCRKCKRCRDFLFEIQISPCVRNKDAVCRCKDGYYRFNIDNLTYECYKCSTCKDNEREVQKCSSVSNTVCECKDNYYRVKNNCSSECSVHCPRNKTTKAPPDTSSFLINVIAGVAVAVLFMLVLVVVVTHLATKRQTKKKLLSSSQLEEPPEIYQELTVHCEEPFPGLQYEASPLHNVMNLEASNLPDCVPLELNMPEVIYFLLELVPVHQVKQLVRSLGVSDTVIERAELDHRSSKEAHYQMLRAWAEQGGQLRRGGVQGGVHGGVLHLPQLQELVHKLRLMHLEQTVQELENNLPTGAHLNGAVNGALNGLSLDEVGDTWSLEAEKQREAEGRDHPGDVSPTAETTLHHRGSAESHKKFYSYQRRTKQKVVTDFSTVSKGTSAGAKPRVALRQVLFNQTEKNPAPEVPGQLDLLRHHLEAFSVPVSLGWRWAEQNHGCSLESNWTEIVHSHAVTPLLLFSNLPSIISAHQLFWQEVLFPMLEAVRRTGAPFDPMCLEFRKRFSSYKHYCWEEESTQEFARRLQESNPHFHAFVQWIESHPQANRMRLGDMQAKPHQRITKYPLLLGAILKNTSHEGVQQALRTMLSCVIRFLESINDYMRFKDEELALSISAERVEGYEVEGINEEIDKRVREVSTFDLSCPVSGVGPEVIRRLLLEGNLKIRGRKDNKMEVVALLFSDVLLMTKVQKKGERLKVIRPPLALDKTHCFALKDGCSFVVVEVGELLSVMNVYIFVTGTTNICSDWVFNIQQAKETLREMRDKEKSRQMDKWRLLLESKSQSEVNGNEAETDAFQERIDKENNGPITGPTPVNGPQLSQAVNGPQLSQAVNGPQLSQAAKRPNPALNRKSDRKSFPGRQPVTPGYESIEMAVRSPGFRTNSDSHMEESSCGAETQGMNGKKVNSVPDLKQHFIFNSTTPHSTRPHSMLVGGYPDVDYPVNDHSTLQKTTDTQNPPGLTWRRASEGMNRRAADSVQVAQGTVRNSLSDNATEPKAFSKELRSPGLRRRRPMSTQGPSDMDKPPLQRPEHNRSVSYNSSSDSDSSIPAKRNSLPADKNSFRVLTLNSLLPNMFWSMKDDSQTVSESELPEQKLHNRRATMKAQRSASIPNIVLQEQSLQRPTRSPLEGLLNRAKERGRDSMRRDSCVKEPVSRLKVPRSPSVSTSPSPTPSEASRESEWEEEVELLRHRVLSVSQGWREQLVDGDDDWRRSPMFSDGVNVDWAGWCLDDEDLMDHLQPGTEGLLEGINKSLASMDLQERPELPKHEDGECSQQILHLFEPGCL